MPSSSGPSPPWWRRPKWRKPTNPDGVPTFSCDGLICTLETYKDKVKPTFARGASLDDPTGVFNASLDAGTRRALDLREGDPLDEDAFVELVRRAVAAQPRLTGAPTGLRRSRTDRSPWRAVHPAGPGRPTDLGKDVGTSGYDGLSPRRSPPPGARVRSLTTGGG